MTIFKISLNNSDIINKIPKNQKRSFEKVSNGKFWTVVDCTIDDLENHIKAGKAWMPGILVEGTRREDENVLSAETLGVDIDENWTWEDIRTNSFINTYASLVMTSYSSTKENPKVRVIFILGEKISGCEIKPCLKKIYDILGKKVDSKCSDPSRFYYGNNNNPETLLKQDVRLYLHVINQHHEMLKKKGNSVTEEFSKYAPISPIGEIVSTNQGVKISLKGVLPRGILSLLRNPSASGSRNSDGFTIACALVAAEDYLQEIRQPFFGSPYEIFIEWCEKCDQGDWDSDEWETIWQSANSKNRDVANYYEIGDRVKKQLKVLEVNNEINDRNLPFTMAVKTAANLKYISDNIEQVDIRYILPKNLANAIETIAYHGNLSLFGCLTALLPYLASRLKGVYIASSLDGERMRPSLWTKVVGATGDSKSKYMDFLYDYSIAEVKPIDITSGMAKQTSKLIQKLEENNKDEAFDFSNYSLTERTIKRVASDSTPERLYSLLSSNSNMLIYKDELANFIDMFSRYTKGNSGSPDVQNLMSIWSGRGYISDRVSRESEVTNSPLSIYGSNQVIYEAKLQGNNELINNGFNARWLIAATNISKIDVPTDPGYFSLDEAKEYVISFAECFSNIAHSVIEYSDEAKDYFEGVRVPSIKKMVGDKKTPYQKALIKNLPYSAYLNLVFHLIDQVDTSLSSGEKINTRCRIEKSTVLKVDKVIDRYNQTLEYFMLRYQQSFDRDYTRYIMEVFDLIDEGYTKINPEDLVTQCPDFFSSTIGMREKNSERMDDLKFTKYILKGLVSIGYGTFDGHSWFAPIPDEDQEISNAIQAILNGSGIDHSQS